MNLKKYNDYRAAHIAVCNEVRMTLAQLKQTILLMKQIGIDCSKINDHLDSVQQTITTHLYHGGDYEVVEDGIRQTTVSVGFNLCGFSKLYSDTGIDHIMKVLRDLYYAEVTEIKNDHAKTSTAISMLDITMATILTV